jgi:hypothetical protein
VDHQLIPGWLHDADVFVLPSFTEGHPKALIEAMAAGVPSIVSDCAGNRAIVKDGDAGLLFDPHRPADLGRSSACSPTIVRLALDAVVATSFPARTISASWSRRRSIAPARGGQGRCDAARVLFTCRHAGLLDEHWGGEDVDRLSASPDLR